MPGQRGFWDVDERYGLLSKAGIHWSGWMRLCQGCFQKPLAQALKRSDGAKGGRPPYRPLMMFKILVLQALYDLSDDRAEFVITDRLSFMRFIGVELGDKVPDAKTIGCFVSILPKQAMDNHRPV